MLREDDGAGPSRRLVDQARHLRRVGDRVGAQALGRQKRHALAASEGDGAGLLEQQRLEQR